MTDLFIKNIHDIGYAESQSLNFTDNGIPREKTKKREPEPLTLEEIIALKGTESFYRFHEDTLKAYTGYALSDPRLKKMRSKKEKENCSKKLQQNNIIGLT